MSNIPPTWEPAAWWDVITSVATVMLVFGIFLAYSQLKVVKNQNRLEAFSRMLEDWGGGKNREDREYIRSGQFYFWKGRHLASLDPQNRRRVESVLATCNRISFMGNRRLIAPHDVKSMFGDSMTDIWVRTQHFVEERRKDDPNYMKDFNDFFRKHLRRYIS